MPKRKNYSKKPKDQDADLNDNTVDPTDTDYTYDEVEIFHNEQDKALLENESSSDSESSDEEEIYNVNPSSDDDKDNEVEDGEDCDEDSEEQSEMEDELDLPGVASRKAWGTKKSNYYDADNYDHLEGLERDEALENEAAEGQKIQEELMNELDLFRKPKSKGKKATGSKQVESSADKKDYYKKDYSEMTEEELREEVAKKYPLVFPLQEMLKQRKEEFKFMERVLPLVFLKRFKLSTSKWIVRRYRTLGHNCMYITFYLGMKKTQVEDPNNEMEEGLREAMLRLKKEDKEAKSLTPLLEFMLSDEQKDYWMKGADKIQKPVHLKTLWKEIEDYQENHRDEYEKFRKERISEWHKVMREQGLCPRKNKSLKRKVEKESESPKKKVKATQERYGEDSSSSEEESEEEDVDEKRGITRQIEKNTGYKKSSKKKNKLNRNPRVKHKEKYRRAQIRRKGAVRPVVTEVTKYQGERSGIRSNVIRSTKL